MSDIEDNTRQKNICVAVDLGSTTISVHVLKRNEKANLEYSFQNPQTVYGADVITRVNHCIQNPSLQVHMKELVLEKLHSSLQEKLGEDYSSISHIVLCGNTVMQHIIRLNSMEGLATAPFHPVDLSYSEQLPYVFPPGFSAFVGSDILLGANYLKMGKTAKFDLLVDLGTNGEILLLNESSGFATSTACGPVFDHVISGARYGSESINAIAKCVKRNLISKSGMIKEPFFDKGIVLDRDFTITQQNVRNFQLAKGAIHAGIQCLMQQANITEADIDNVYLSGGLGLYINVRDAMLLKMFPVAFEQKIKVVNNTSLQGAKQLASAIYESLDGHSEFQKELLSNYSEIRSKTTSYELSNLLCFQEIYIQSLNF